jgi:hydroxypyruvate reductase
MSSRLPEGVTFAAIATDGVDGASGTAGAIVSGPLEGSAEALASFETGPLHLAARTAIPMGATGLNFADLHVLMR